MDSEERRKERGKRKKENKFIKLFDLIWFIVLFSWKSCSNNAASKRRPKRIQGGVRRELAQLCDILNKIYIENKNKNKKQKSNLHPSYLAKATAAVPA